MLFTRTIRRKMMFGLAVILVMLLTLYASGVSGLKSYRAMIDDLRYSMIETPRMFRLVKSVGTLFEPLTLKLPDTNEEAARYQQSLFAEKLQAVRREIAEFHRGLDNLEPTEAVNRLRPVTKGFLNDLETGEGGLDDIAAQEPQLANPKLRAQTAEKMLHQVIRLQLKLQNAPDLPSGLHSTLDEAERVYRSRLTLVRWSTGIVFVIFLALSYYTYRNIFAPLKKLHAGAQRVAQGDLEFRVEVNSNDEMAELAASLNRMTARFLEIKRDLDREVRDRCRQLVRSERLADIGFLAAGVAHEINNPLSAINMAAESLAGRGFGNGSPGGNGSARDPEDDEVARQYLEMIQREAFRCQTITRRLLDFARGQDATRTPNDLTFIIEEVIAMLSPMSKYRDRTIELEHQQPCVIEVNGPEIKQVVLNIVANALESMEAGGTLRVRIVEKPEQVAMVFEDDGCGMSAEVIEKLFEPFFTRRKDGKGTGLGMSISNRIVNDHGGTIEASSPGPGKGSTFVVHLPRKAAVEQAAA